MGAEARDVVERLRSHAMVAHTGFRGCIRSARLAMTEAADTIESLRSEVASLRGRLEDDWVPVWIRDEELRDLQRDPVNCAIVERRDPDDTDDEGCVRATLTLHRTPPDSPESDKVCPCCGRATEPERRDITPAQRGVYEFVVEYRAANGCSPTVSEICDAFGYRTLATAHGHLTNMERRGWMRRTAMYEARNWIPT